MTPLDQDNSRIQVLETGTHRGERAGSDITVDDSVHGFRLGLASVGAEIHFPERGSQGSVEELASPEIRVLLSSVHGAVGAVPRRGGFHRTFVPFGLPSCVS